LRLLRLLLQHLLRALLPADENRSLLGAVPDMGRSPRDLLPEGLRMPSGDDQGLLLQERTAGSSVPGDLLQMRSGRAHRNVSGLRDAESPVSGDPVCRGLRSLPDDLLPAVLPNQLLLLQELRPAPLLGSLLPSRQLRLSQHACLRRAYWTLHQQ